MRLEIHSRMRIGVAIPCFIKHISKCHELLESINQQTRLPDQVVVSCSSSKPEDFFHRDYKFPLKIIITGAKQNTAQNRNAAAKLLDTDIITFMDADDLMHPQRLEIIEKAVEDGADIVLHSFFHGKECEQPFPTISDYQIKPNIMDQCGNGCIKFKDFNTVSRIHHAQPSIKQWIFKKLQFPEEPSYELTADCVYCFRVFAIPDIQSAYIPLPMSKYNESLTCFAENQ